MSGGVIIVGEWAGGERRETYNFMNEEPKNKCPKCRTTLTGRHCLGCGWSRKPTQEEQERTGELKLNKKPEPGDGAKLIEVMGRYALTLPRNAAEWRVAYGKDGQDVRGELRGIVMGEVRLLCTDGVVAWFVLGDGETVLFGHLGNLVVSKPESVGQPHGERKSDIGATKRAKNIALAMALLGDVL